MIVALGMFAACLLAFANGANDISKSIATLVGSGEASYKKAVVIVALAVSAGAVMASAWAVKMSLLFTKGLLAPTVQTNQFFALAVLAGAIVWVLFATRFGMPVSTTHAIVGSVILTGFYAFGFSSILWDSVFNKVVVPLLLSPVVALALSYVLFKGLFWLCREKYCLNCDWVHWMSAIASGFGRGLNDTPKMAALGLVFYYLVNPAATVAPKWFFLLLAIANAAGAIVWGLKVTETLGLKVFKMDHLEGFAANLATSSMVITTAIFGFPVSTTHVSSSAIIGMGLHKGVSALNLNVIRDIVLAWVITLPAAGMVGVAAYWALTRA